MDFKTLGSSKGGGASKPEIGTYQEKEAPALPMLTCTGAKLVPFASGSTQLRLYSGHDLEYLQG